MRGAKPYVTQLKFVITQKQTSQRKRNTSEKITTNEQAHT